MSYSFEFKNNKDKAKITNIEFISNDKALVTVNDSRIRLIKISNGQVLKEFIGINNNDTMIRASYDEISNRVICSGDDGKVAIWCNKNTANEQLSLLKHKMLTIDAYEVFTPFKADYKIQSDVLLDIKSEKSKENVKKEDEPAHICVCTVFVKEKMLAEYSEKVNTFLKDVFVRNIIVNCSNKRLIQVIGNFENLRSMGKRIRENSLTYKFKKQNRIV